MSDGQASPNAAKRAELAAQIADNREKRANSGNFVDYEATRANGTDVINLVAEQAPKGKLLDGNPVITTQFTPTRTADRVMFTIGSKTHSPFPNELAAALGLDAKTAGPADVQFGVDYDIVISAEHATAREEVKQGTVIITFGRKASCKMLPAGTMLS